MSNNIPQDTITFQLSDDMTITNDTVKITVPVNVSLVGDLTEETFRQKVRSALSSFINTDWKFGGINRETDSSGIERINFVAVSRITEGMNYDLRGRADRVSTHGLALGTPVIDNSVPPTMILDAERKLRLSIIKRALQEVAEINTETKLDLRLSHIDFNAGDPYSATKFSNALRNTKSMSYGSGFISNLSVDASSEDEEETTLANAHKIAITANVTLSRFPLGN